MIDAISKSSQLPALQMHSPQAVRVDKPADVGSFDNILKQVASDAIDGIRAGEKAAIGGLNGKVPIQNVVEQVMAAERSLQTVISVRDKVVAAYQEISRMAI